MPEGKIKKLIADKGFGFIQAEEGGDIFFHFSGLEGITIEELREGDLVEYVVEQSEKGPRARSIRLVSEAG